MYLDSLSLNMLCVIDIQEDFIPQTNRTVMKKYK